MRKLLVSVILLSLIEWPVLAIPSTVLELIQARNKTAQIFQKLVFEPQILEREWRKFYKYEGIDFQEKEKPILEFSWNNCAPNAPVNIKQLSISPDPIVIPGDITISFDTVVGTNITSPLNIDLTLEKSILSVWVKIPCVDNMGSCSYSDACALVPNKCPSFIKKAGLPCKCPIPKNKYHLNPSSFPIPNIPMPSFLEDGDYRATVVGKFKQEILFCYNFAFSLHKR